MHGNEVVVRIIVEAKPSKAEGPDPLDGIEVGLHQLEVTLERSQRAVMYRLSRIERLLLVPPGPAPRTPTSISIQVTGPFRE